MRLLMAYLKSIRKFLFMLFICILIFAAVFSLYDLPVEAVVYGALLSFVIMLICGISDYIKFIKKHKNLSELEADIAISIERLGTAKNQIEQDYIDLIKALFKDKQEYIAKSDRKDLICWTIIPYGFIR